jgi:hypothetical protein
MYARTLQPKLDAPIATGRSRATRRIAALTAITAAAALMVAFAQKASAEDLKCEAGVEVFNDKTTAIKVLRFAYKTPDGQCKSKDGCNEGLSNKKLAPGESATWPLQTLGNVAEGNPVNAVAVEYQDDTSGQKSPSDPWGKAHWSNWHLKPGNDCKDGHTYKVHVG